MSFLKKYHLLLLIVAIGAILRLWGINFGLPYQFHQDEPIVVNHALAYGAGDFNPHFFAIPPLTSYLLFFIYGIFFVLGYLFNIFANSDMFALEFFKDPSIFYILGRFFIGFLPGILSVIFSFVLYRKLFDSIKGALFTAAIMSFVFLNVVHSHYIYTDMLLVLTIIFTIIKISDMLKNSSFKNYILSGTLIGIAIGIKYNAALLIVPYMLTHLIVCKGKLLNKNLFIGIFAAIGTFIIVNPFSVLDFRFFVFSIIGQAGASGYIGWRHHIAYSLHQGAGIFIVMCGFLGMIALCVKNMSKAILVLSFPLAFYIHLVFLSQHFPRYVLPLIPFFAICSGYLIFEYIFPKLKNKTAKILIIGLCFSILTLSIVKSVTADLMFSIKDTRIIAAEWIQSNINPDSKIAVDHTFFRPVILQNKQQLIEKANVLNKQIGLTDIKQKKLQLALQARKSAPAYNIYFLTEEPEMQGQFLATVPALPFGYEYLKDEGIEYIIINYANRLSDAPDFYDTLKDEAILIKDFSPYHDNEIRFSYDRIATTCLPVLSEEIYSRNRSGPAIEIYRLKR